MISVIIPLYNCESYIEKAILSAIHQKFVDEIIVVDDGSTDASFKLVSTIQNKYKKIMLYQHIDKKNHGRSATRNLGIKKATCKYIAFLDADDYYLPDRFVNDKIIFENDTSVDGVYNAISADFYREPSNIEKSKLKLTTVREKIDSKNLFEKMGPFGHYGYFSGIGLTVKKDIFDKVGYFNEKLEVAEDTDLWIKMSLVSKLVPGVTDSPVAMRGVHDKNISFKADSLYNNNYLIMYESLYYWSLKKEVSLNRVVLIWNKIWLYRYLNNDTFFSNLIFWFKNCFYNPVLLTQWKVYKTFPVFKKIKFIFTAKQ